MADSPTLSALDGSRQGIDDLIAAHAIEPGEPPSRRWLEMLDRHRGDVPDGYRYWMQRIGAGTFGPAELELFADPRPLDERYRVSNREDYYRIGRDASGIEYCWHLAPDPWALVALTPDSIMPILGLDFVEVLRESLERGPALEQRHDESWDRAFRWFVAYAAVAVVILAVVAFVVFFRLKAQVEASDP